MFFCSAADKKTRLGEGRLRGNCKEIYLPFIHQISHCLLRSSKKKIAKVLIRTLMIDSWLVCIHQVMDVHGKSLSMREVQELHEVKVECHSSFLNA